MSTTSLISFQSQNEYFDSRGNSIMNLALLVSLSLSHALSYTHTHARTHALGKNMAKLEECYQPGERESEE